MSDTIIYAIGLDGAFWGTTNPIVDLDDVSYWYEVSWKDVPINQKHRYIWATYESQGYQESGVNLTIGNLIVKDAPPKDYEHLVENWFDIDNPIQTVEPPKRESTEFDAVVGHLNRAIAQNMLNRAMPLSIELDGNTNINLIDGSIEDSEL